MSTKAERALAFIEALRQMSVEEIAAVIEVHMEDGLADALRLHATETLEKAISEEGTVSASTLLRVAIHLICIGYLVRADEDSPQGAPTDSFLN